MGKSTFSDFKTIRFATMIKAGSERSDGNQRIQIIKRVRAGMHRATLESRQVGRRQIDVDRTECLPTGAAAN